MNMNSETPAGVTQDAMQLPDTNEDSGALRELLSKNHAKGMDEDKLNEIGQKCRRGFDYDWESCQDWMSSLDEWICLAKQVKEVKNWPWPKASNIKYPLLATASMQFAARAYPALVPSNGQVVRSSVIGKDPDGQKWEKAQRVSTFMSYQLMHDMAGWEEDMDRMLMQLPVVGCMFKKTYFDKNKNKNVSKLVLPSNFVVNYWTTTLDETERVSEIIYMSPRVYQEYVNKDIFLDQDLGQAPIPENAENSPSWDETTPYTFIEQHTFLDLDDDDYAEPYIVTFHKESGKVLSIYRRHTLDDVETDDKGKLIRITATQMYTKFGFIPNPDGSFYDIGFGSLLGPINESVNTNINQLTDSGTLNNLQSGFIGKALKMKMGDQPLGVGEWRPVNAGGDDLRKQIVPLPAKEPSKVLLELLQLLITSGKELASVAEIFTGKMPGQNTPATTTMATVEQGMKVFTAIYKRIYRALGEEFKKLYKLNKTYLDPNTIVAVLDEPVGPDDFDSSLYDVCPGADPNATTGTEKLMKAQGLVEILPLIPGLLDPIEVVSRVLEAQEQPNWQKLFSQQVQASGQLPPPPPDPKLMAIQAKVQADQQKNAADLQFKQQEMELESRDKQQQMAMQQQEHAQKMQHMQEQAQVKSASDIAMANVFAATERAKGQQTLQNSQAAHDQKMQQAKEQQSLQRSNSPNGGKTQPQGKSKKP
jgi:chaperonin GroES